MGFMEKTLAWGPVAFGVLIFAPMWAAVMDALGLALPLGMTNLAFTLVIGFAWGMVAKLRGRWL